MKSRMNMINLKSSLLVTERVTPVFVNEMRQAGS